MASYQIESCIEILRRIVLSDVHKPFSRIRRAYGVVYVIEQYVSERIVHSGIQLIAHEILAALAIAYLVACVLPYFTEQEPFRICRFDPRAGLRYE